MSFLRKTGAIFVIIAISLAIFPSVVQTSSSLPGLEERASPAASTQGSFALVSSFNNGGNYGDYGWYLVASPSPSITTSVNYFGEPSLSMSPGSTVADNRGVITGEQTISFQFAVNSQASMSVFSIIDSAGASVLSVGVLGSAVYAGQSTTDIQFVGQAPSVSAYPNGWVYLSANIFNSSTNKAFSWTAQLFVDGSSAYLANLSVPQAFQYAGIELSSPSAGSSPAYFTDIVFSTYEIPILIPGYNPMEGYGQGSGLLVNLLQPFTVLHATMTLSNWNVPEGGILSFQINAMNYYGTTRSTCRGFFQLGVDLNPDGLISPWYVPGVNCFAHYFLNSNNPAVQPGFHSPPGSVIELNIVYSPANKTITFSIADMSVPLSSGDRYWNATIPYSGTAFYATYTQLEFQPSSSYPIGQYYFNGTMEGIAYGNSPGSLSPLNESYMLPYTLNAPPGWSFTYYSNQQAGYSQIA